MKNIKLFIIIILGFLTSHSYSQITAPNASFSFPTNYSPAYTGSGGTNDLVYVFCSNQNINNAGELTINAPGCLVTWFKYDGFSYSPIGQTGYTATGLTNGLYMAKVDCGGSTSCHKAWVWVNQTYVNVNPIAPGCETFTLTGQVNVLDNQFTISDPPGIDFEIDANTYIQICFWANHTYVSDLGFYLKAPGHAYSEPGTPGVVALLPAASDWGINGTHQSNLTIPWTVTGCAPDQENTPCNSGNNLEEFCFGTNYFYGGPALTPGNPSQTPCVCSMTTPLTGLFAPAESWSGIYGFMAGQAGWAVQIYDCEPVDYGALTMARLVFSKQTECGQTTYIYDSGSINSTINDNSCSAATASIYIVPPQPPAGSYTVTSSISNINWTCTGSSFTGNQLSHQIVQGTPDFPTQTSDFILTVTETVNVPGNPSCQISDAETFYTLPTDATITPIPPKCANDAPFVLQAANTGGIWTTNAPEGSLINNIFYPSVAGGGTWTINYAIGGPCPDQDQTTITIYETLTVQNFSDQVCDGTGDNYTVSFNVVNNQGQPANFQANFGMGFQTYTGSFSRQFPTQTSYSITVTDFHNCTEIVLNGYRDCGCTTFAGTFSSYAPINLCQNQCINNTVVSHNGNHVLDANDMMEFIIHDGGNPMTILAYNSTNPNFCLSNIIGGQPGQVYYLAAIAGNNAGGHVSLIDPCKSMTISIPVIWHANPIAFISPTEISTCGLSVELSANSPNTGEIGTWTANGDFFVTSGTVNSPNITAIKPPPYGDLTFTWTVVNNICSASDDVVVHFLEVPNAYAGEDITICGTQAELNAIPSLPGTSGFWSGIGSFQQQSNPTTTVNGNIGTFIYTWREINGTCWDEDQVAVTFVQEPQPITTPNVDTVCGIQYQLNVYNVTGTGYWTAYQNGIPYTPAPIYQQGNTSPSTSVILTYGTSLFVDIDFVWTETQQYGSLQCTNTATKRVRFARQPVASVGPIDQAEVCGNCYTFNADIIGQNWASGMWIAKDILGEWTNNNNTSPNAEFCISPFASFGDTAHVRVDFLWTMYNSGCTSIDTMTVIFYKRPQANAGLDNAVCGNNYTLGAVYNLPQSNGYNPSGLWSVFTRPNVTPTPSATFANLNNDTTLVTVSHTGIWQFIFRENNSLLPSCFSTDTVRIEFVEVPIISAGPDKHVCGQCTQLEGTSAGYSMSWTDNGAQYSDYTIPNPNVCVNTYGPRQFVMIETNMSQPPFTLSCQSKDTVIITFWRVPSANILTDEADSTVCGLTFPRLRAENPGTGIRGYWITNNPFTQFSPNAYTWNNASATVPSYGYHDFYWIEETGPEDMPGFCTDTAGPLRIHFIQIPTANAGNDTLFCGFTGTLNAIPSVGSGVWSTPSTQNISFNNPSSPNATVTSNILNAGNPGNPFFLLIWTEDNTNGCTDKDTIKVQFARIPSSETIIIPPKCFGEEATIRAVEDTLQQYTWNFFNGQIVQSFTNSQGGNHRNFVRWNDGRDFHIFNLITTNYWGCNSPIAIDTVYEPPIPEFDVTIIKDTCALGKGGLIFNENSPTTAFFWINTEVGPAPGPITQVLNIPAGDYGIRTSYLTPNTQYISHYLSTFGTQYCIDTFFYTIPTVGMIEAMIEVAASVDLENLVAPNAVVTFLNNSVYDDVRKRCEWNFGDGTKLKNCDPMVEHTYTKSGCYEPFLIVMNRDLPECRDTARLSACIQVDDESMLEIPNIFSPNGDGINDFFQVKARTLKTFTGQIVNRYGRVVYTWENWQDYEAGWDGNLEGGTKAAPGVYYYIIKATGWDDKEYNKQGVLHLMRN